MKRDFILNPNPTYCISFCISVYLPKHKNKIMATLKLYTVGKLLRSQKLVMFSKTFCPFCKLAKSILRKAGVSEMKVVELDELEEKNGNDIQVTILKIILRFIMQLALLLQEMFVITVIYKNASISYLLLRLCQCKLKCRWRSMPVMTQIYGI